MDRVKGALDSVKADAARLVSPPPKRPLVPRAAAHGIPRPRPAAHLQTSDETHAAQLVERQKEIQKNDAVVQTSVLKLKDGALPPGERAKQLWGVVRGFAGVAVNSAVSGTSRVLHDTSSQIDQREFESQFHLGPEARYLNSFTCAIADAGVPVKCTLYISSTHVCVSASCGIHDTLPLQQIASIVPCVSLATTDQPLLFPLPDPRVKPDSLQIFTTSQTVWEISLVSHSVRHLTTPSSLGAVGLLYAELDKAWRAAAQVPNPSVTYVS